MWRFPRGRLQTHFFKRIARWKQARVCARNSIPSTARSFHGMIDRGATLYLFTIHVLEEKLFEQLINKRSIYARNTPRSQSPTILQNVFANHLDAGLINPALP